VHTAITSARRHARLSRNGGRVPGSQLPSLRHRNGGVDVRSWAKPTECELCGQKGRDIDYQLVEWIEGLPGMKYQHVARCDDRTACRARVEDRGETWNVNEGTAA
jgi:hypothetical protein